MKLFTRGFLIQYTLCALLFICIDLVWISVVARQIYLETLSPILSSQPAWVPALMFYALYAFGLWFLAIRPSVKAEDAGLRGGILGLTAYGTYALTGHALFAGWTWTLTVADCAWGMLLSAVVAFIVRKVALSS